MKILFVSSEVAPFAKSGGLADVSGALPKAIKDLGHDIRVIMPKYKMVDEKKFSLEKIFDKIDIQFGITSEEVSIYESKIPGSDVIIYFVENENMFGRDGLYQENGIDYPDNAERFILFSKAVIKFLVKLGWQPNIMHCNDWQSALLVAYIKILYKDNNFLKNISTVYSVHNLVYLGLFDSTKLPLTGLGWDRFSPDGLEFFGRLAFSKAGIVYGDVINTVSETYSKEIQTPEYGCGLEGLMKYRSSDLFGILNGIDYDVWNPGKDPYIARNYSENSLVGKTENKKKLQAENNLPVKKDIPLIGIISRLDKQKGFDILSEAMEKIMHMELQFVILGTGDTVYHDLFKKMKETYPDHIGVNLGFEAALAQLIYAGCDMFLMPSKYEPCGLGQLISFKYGTVPIVRKTGGLADTVQNYDPQKQTGNGFVFEEYSSGALIDAVKRAVMAYKDKKKWEALMKKDMNLDFSWESSAKKYLSLYKKAIEKVSSSR